MNKAARYHWKLSNKAANVKLLSFRTLNLLIQTTCSLLIQQKLAYNHTLKLFYHQCDRKVNP